MRMIYKDQYIYKDHLVRMMITKVHQVRMRIRSSSENDDEDDVLQVGDGIE